MEEIPEKSGNFVSSEKWEPCCDLLVQSSQSTWKTLKNDNRQLENLGKSCKFMIFDADERFYWM